MFIKYPIGAPLCLLILFASTTVQAQSQVAKPSRAAPVVEHTSHQTVQRSQGSSQRQVNSADAKLKLVLAKKQEKKLKGLSCRQLSDAVKYSRCAGGIGALLQGANLLLGVNVAGNNVTVRDKQQQTLAVLKNETSLTPVVSLVLKPSFFNYHDASQLNLFGWGVAFSYSDRLANLQQIKRSGQNHEKNLSTYLAARILAASPNVFYQYGGATSRRYIRLGAGLAFGYFSLDGYLYETDDVRQTQCYQAASDYVLGAGIGVIEQNCQRKRINESSWGIGTYTFLTGRFENWSLEFSGAGSEIDLPGGRTLSPSFVNIIGSYHIAF